MRLRQAWSKVINTRFNIIFPCLFMVMTTLAWGSEQQSGAQEANSRRTPVTATTAISRDIEVWESSVGQLETRVEPLIAAEVEGQLGSMNVEVGELIKQGQLLAEIIADDFHLSEAMAEADIDRLEALLHAQHLKTERYRALVRKELTNQSTLDDAEAQEAALQAELASFRVRLQQAQRDIKKARITSPVDGRIDEIRVSQGSYVTVGSPLMRITNLQRLRARLPYPETLLPQLRSGLPVRLTSPSAPGVTVQSSVSDVRPSVTIGSRAAQIIINVENPGPWKPGATVTGTVRVALHEDAIMLPEVSVVLRPAGTIVYVLKEGIAVQRMITTGLRQNGYVEILSGLEAGEQVAADGAAFLTDGAPVDVKDS
ncbi:MAG: efflux RND transporter periplasmic adaptor subunit [Gammaproteobacteria bacterium]|nr:MAG: efflux RND transporter periplasmic adaptor subunit [Gammaproteobacteria bacterium]